MAKKIIISRLSARCSVLPPRILFHKNHRVLRRLEAGKIQRVIERLRKSARLTGRPRRIRIEDLENRMKGAKNESFDKLLREEHSDTHLTAALVAVRSTQRGFCRFIASYGAVYSGKADKNNCSPLRCARLYSSVLYGSGFRISVATAVENRADGETASCD